MLCCSRPIGVDNLSKCYGLDSTILKVIEKSPDKWRLLSNVCVTVENIYSISRNATFATGPPLRPSAFAVLLIPAVSVIMTVRLKPPSI